MMETEQEGRLEKSWWNCIKEDIKSFAYPVRTLRTRINGETAALPANPGCSGK